MESERRISRRQMLCLFAGLPLALAAAGQGSAVLPAVRRAFAGGSQIRGGSIRLASSDITPSTEGAGADGRAITPGSGKTGSAESGSLTAPFPFQAVGAIWHGDPGVSIFLRTSGDGSRWGPWTLAEEELAIPNPSSRARASGLVFTDDGFFHRYVQARLSLPRDGGTWEAQDLELAFIDASAGPTPRVLSAAVEGPSASLLQYEVDSQGVIVGQFVAKPPVVSRAGWGCPDPEGNLPGANGQPWVKEYRSVTHLVVHHTVNANTEPKDGGWPAAVRAIWYWHAVQQPNAWGDMGYNYLVDPNGVLYEGRAGGDDVIAGHTYTFNAATLGFAFIGTYSTVEPSAAAIAAAERLFAWKSGQKGFHPSESGDLYHTCENSYVFQQRLAGHRDFVGLACPGYQDLNNTSCPGNALHALLPRIRTETEQLLDAARPEMSNVSISPALIAVGSSLQIALTIRNAGTAPMYSGSPVTTQVYDEGQVASWGPPGVYRIGLDYEGRPASLGAYPYRWGLGGDLAPGESRTLTLNVRITQESGPRRYWVGLVYEGTGMVLDHVAENSVTARVKTFGHEVGIAKVSIGPSTVFTQSMLAFEAEVQNWSTQAAPTQARPPGYVYAEGEARPGDEFGAYRIGVGYDGADHPYRWGIDTAPMPPLSVRTVRGYIKMPVERSSRRFWVSFVREGVAWLQQDVASAEVKVQVPRSRVRLPMVGGGLG